MKLETKLKKLCSGDVEIVNIDSSQNSVEVLLPYSNGSFDIEIDGDTDEERIESFKEGVNRQLQDMINHLDDCKL